MSSLEEYDRLSTMADGLLFLARAESRVTKPSWSVIHLAEQARAVCEFYEGVAEERDVALEVEGGASIAVVDDGSGIAAADLPHVLERFYRSSTTRSRGVHGSGLGLAIVKSIMELHGGTIDVSSAPGR